MMLEWFREREARGDLVLPVPAASRATQRTPVPSNRKLPMQHTTIEVVMH